MMSGAGTWPAGVEAACSLLYLMIVVSCNFRPRLRPGAHVAVMVAVDLLFFLCYRPIEMRQDNYTLYLVCLLVASLSFAMATTRGDRLALLNFVMICNFVVVVLKSIVIAACGGVLAAIDSPTIRAGLWHGLYYAGLAACGWFLIRFATHARLPRRYWVALLPCTLTVAVFATLSGQPFMHTSTVTYQAFNAASFWLVMLVYYLTHLIADEFTHRAEAEAANVRLSAQVEQFTRAQSAIDRFRKERHEMKNTYFYISTLVKQREYEALERYLDTALNYRIVEMEEISTGNPTLDLVLTQKIGEARQANINVTTNLTLPPDLPFPDPDLCALLLNLLDNAIDASVREPDRPGAREIVIAIRQTKNFLSIQISNHVSGDVLAENPTLHTTKPDSANHGIGLQVVRSIVDKYDGMLRYDSPQGLFTVSVLLQYPDGTAMA